MSCFASIGRVAATLCLAAGLALPGLSAAAHDYTLGDLKIGHPWSRATPPATSTTSA